MLKSNSEVIINLPVGTVAALLTTCEFILSTITALAARAAIRGMWLLTLHTGGKAPVSVAARARRAFVRDALIFIIGLFLVVSVALVEAGLNTTYIVGREPIFDGDNCVRLDRPFNPDYMEFLIPSIQTGIKPWIETVIDDIGCNTSSLISVGTGDAVDIHGGHRKFFAPVCGKENIIHPKDASISIDRLKVEPTRLALMAGHSEMVEIFPHSKDMILNIPIHVDSDIEEIEADSTIASECTAKNLSGITTYLRATWMSSSTRSESLATSVINALCSLHDSKSQVILTLTDITECIFKPHMDLRVDCLRKKGLLKSALQTARLTDVSALFVKKTRQESSFVCLSAELEVEYVLVTGEVITEFQNYIAPRNPILIPTKVSAISGHCEKTIHVSGRAALIYTIEAEWRKTYLAAVDRVARYHALMTAVSDSQFPLSHLDRKASDEKKPCALRPVSVAAQFPHGARITMLYTAVGVAAILMILGIILRWLFRGRSWVVGSAHWSLQQFAGDDYWDEKVTIGQETEFEVIVEDEEENDNNANDDLQNISNSFDNQPRASQQRRHLFSLAIPGWTSRYKYCLRRVTRNVSNASKTVDDV